MVRFAVIGLGGIAQEAVLPAFAHTPNARLAALVSRSRTKLAHWGRRHGVPHLYTLGEIDNCLLGGTVDAVYLALPNDLHCKYAVMAANAYKHVLCEKPLALTVEEGELVAQAARRRHVKCMTAYRLHGEPATRATRDLARSGKLGELRTLQSTFGFALKDRNDIRASAARGGGALYDIGVYCINAARNLFADEPTEVFAVMPPPVSAVFKAVDESVAVLMKFPRGRTASFTASFALADTCRLEVIGTKGKVVLDPAYIYSGGLTQEVTIGGRTRRRKFPAIDQFAEEINHFADCITRDKEPRTGLAEGIADLRVIEAIQKSARLNRAVKL